MERHYLQALFAPASIVVFTGAPDQEGELARLVNSQLRSGSYKGPLRWLDADIKGTLGELAEARADLAIIALPNEELASALEVAGRLRCRSAMLLSNGVGPELARSLHAVAQRHGMQ